MIIGQQHSKTLDKLTGKLKIICKVDPSQQIAITRSCKYDNEII